MASVWIPLLLSTLHAQASKALKYVAAGSWCVILSEKQVPHGDEAEQDVDTHIVAEAALVNLGNTVYAKATFFIPGHLPDASIASYKAIFDKNGQYYTVTNGGARPVLRLTTPNPIVVPLPALVTAWHIMKSEDSVKPISTVIPDGSRVGDKNAADASQPKNNDGDAEEQSIYPVSAASEISSDHEPSSPDTEHSLNSKESFRDGKQDQAHHQDECVEDKSVNTDTKYSDCVTLDTGPYLMITCAGNTDRALQGSHTDKRNPRSSMIVTSKVDAGLLVDYRARDGCGSLMKRTPNGHNTVVHFQRDITRAVCQPTYSQAVVLQEMSDQIACSNLSKLVVLSSSSQATTANGLMKCVASSSDSGIPRGWELTDTIVFHVLPGYILHEYKVDSTWFLNIYEELNNDIHEDFSVDLESDNDSDDATHENSGMQPAASTSLARLVGNININFIANSIESICVKVVLKAVTISALQAFKKIFQSTFYKPSSVFCNYCKFMSKSAGPPTTRSIEYVSRLLLPTMSTFCFNRDKPILELHRVLVARPSRYNTEAFQSKLLIVSSGNIMDSFKPCGISTSQVIRDLSKAVLPKPSTFSAYPEKSLLKPANITALGMILDNEGSVLPELPMLWCGNNKNLPKLADVSASEVGMSSSKVMLPEQSNFPTTPHKPLFKPAGISAPKMLEYNTISIPSKLSLVSSYGTKKMLTSTWISASRMRTSVSEILLPKPFGVFRKAIEGPLLQLIVQDTHSMILSILVASRGDASICAQPKAVHTTAFTGFKSAPILSTSIPSLHHHTPLTGLSQLLSINTPSSKAQEKTAVLMAAGHTKSGRDKVESADEDKYWKMFAIKHREALNEYCNPADDVVFETDHGDVRSFSSIETLQEFTTFLKETRSLHPTETRSLAMECQALEDYVNSTNDDLQEEDYSELLSIFKKAVSDIDHTEVQSFGTRGQDMEEYVNHTDDDVREENHSELRAISNTAAEDVVSEAGSPTLPFNVENEEIAEVESLQGGDVFKFAGNQRVQQLSPNSFNEEEVVDEAGPMSPLTAQIFEQPALGKCQQRAMIFKVTHFTPMQEPCWVADDNDELSFPHYEYCDQQPSSGKYSNVQFEIKTPRSTPMYHFRDPSLMFNSKEAFTSFADGKEQATGVPRKNNHCRNCSSISVARSVTPMETISEEDDDLLSGLDTAAQSSTDSRSSTPSSETTQIVRTMSNDITEEVFRIAVEVAANEEDRRDYLAETKALEDYCTGIDVSSMSPHSLGNILITLKQRRAVRGLIATNDEKLDLLLACFSPSKKAIKAEERRRNEPTVLADENDDIFAPLVDYFRDNARIAKQKAEAVDSDGAIADFGELGIENDMEEILSMIVDIDDADFNPRLEARERVKMPSIDEDKLPTIQDGDTTIIKDHLIFINSDTITSAYAEVGASVEIEAAMSVLPTEGSSSQQDQGMVGVMREEPLSRTDKELPNDDYQDLVTLEDTEVLTEDFLAPKPATTTKRSWLPRNPIRRCFYGSLVFGVNGTKRVVDGMTNLLHKE